MQDVVKKWGNSAAVRIRASVPNAARVRLDQAVDARAEGGRIVITPTQPARYDVDTLWSGITDENRHASVDMGEAEGRKVW